MLIQLKTWCPPRAGQFAAHFRTNFLKRHFKEDYDEYVKLLHQKYGEELVSKCENWSSISSTST